MDGVPDVGRFSNDELLRLVLELLAADFPGAAELRTQVPGLGVSAPNDSDGSVYLYPTQGRAAPAGYRTPVEAMYRDKRGHQVSALLNVDENGKLAELELVTIGVNDADDRVASLPEAGAATIYVDPGPWKQQPFW